MQIHEHMKATGNRHLKTFLVCTHIAVKQLSLKTKAVIMFIYVIFFNRNESIH